VEGLAKSKDELHPMQVAFKENHGLQCGFCTPGMIMTATDMVARYQAEGKTLTEENIRHELEGNICRCTGYHNIVKSIADGASKMTSA
jgi:carbon-monoxide dehydrogenase small subunit